MEAGQTNNKSSCTLFNTIVSNTGDRNSSYKDGVVNYFVKFMRCGFASEGESYCYFIVGQRRNISATMSMMMESHTLPNMEDKAMEFTMNILDAQFNHEGWYYLMVTLHNSFVNDYSEVQIMEGDGGSWETKRQFVTDTTKQQANSPLSFFKKKKYLFRFPLGFFKNDKNHDVYLLVEAYSKSDESDSGQGRKVGEGKFAIYPRPNAPRMKQYAEPGDDYYNFTEVMSLLRTHSTDNMRMHCGRLRNTYTFSEIVPPTPTTSPVITPPPYTNRSQEKPTPRYTQKPPSPQPVKPPSPKYPSPKHPSPKPPTPKQLSQRKPEPRDYQRQQRTPEARKPVKPTSASSWGDTVSLDLNLPKSPPLPPAADGKRLQESPLPDTDKRTFAADKSYRHVANGGKEQIEVILHGASCIPLTPDGQVPQPFAVVKTKKSEDSGTKNGVSTHPSSRPTHSPSWEEMIRLDVDAKTAEDEVMVVSVADAHSKKGLVNYRVPVSYLKPFHQYHLELNMPAKGIPSGVKTFATVTRKLERLPRDPSCPNYLALEVLLMNAQRPIKTPLGPLIAVARIVPDYYNYKSDNLSSHPRNAGVVMQNITFPSAHPSNFSVTERSHHGHPQISLPGRPEGQPEWNHPYLFLEERDKATLFTPGAALVIEYYVASSAMSDQFWRMQSPVAFSSILMDEEMYKYLMEDRAKGGLRIDGVPMQGSEMQTVDNRRPTVGVILKLVTAEVPDTMTSVSNLDDIPRLDLYPEPDVPGYYRADSAEILRVESQTSNGPAKTKFRVRKPESPLSPPRTPKTPPHDPHAPPQGRYILHKVKKRPLSVRFLILYQLFHSL
ncbi:Coiled-coil domain-containing protein 33 [Mactra antiquata]